MSASALPADTCERCGVPLPPDARQCPVCGAGATSKLDVPPDETGQVPVVFDRAEPHWFGIAPPYLLLAVAVAVAVLAIVLFAGGAWPFALIALGIAALLVSAFLELVRRKPRTPRTGSDVRERAGSLWETWQIRAAAGAETRRIHSGLARVDSRRQAAFHELGRAVYAGDEEAQSRLKGRLAELDGEEAALRQKLDEGLRHASSRIERARLPVQDTVMVTPNEPNAPYPPPDEGTPPEPAIVPEPYPPPDEGTPPTPDPDDD